MREFKFIVFGLILLFFQIRYASFLAIVDFLPNILLGYLFALNISLKLDWALAISFFLGLLFDLTQPHLLGFHTILFVLMGNFINRYHHHTHQENFMVIFITSFLISVSYHFGWFLYFLFFENLFPFQFLPFSVSILYNAILSLAVSYLILLLDHVKLELVDRS